MENVVKELLNMFLSVVLVGCSVVAVYLFVTLTLQFAHWLVRRGWRD